jgi:hypothetical protein
MIGVCDRLARTPFEDAPIKSGHTDGALTERLEEAQGFAIRLVSRGWDQTFANDRVSIRST